MGYLMMLQYQDWMVPDGKMTDEVSRIWKETNMA
jgi:hypothetical protein